MQLMKPYYPAWPIATILYTAGRDVYLGSHWQHVEKGMALMAGSFPLLKMSLSFLFLLLTSPMSSFFHSHHEKLIHFKSVEMKRVKGVLLWIYFNVSLILYVWPASTLHAWVIFVNFLYERERESIESSTLDRHGKGIRQMCCSVWEDQAPGFYCCSSRGPLGSLNFPVKFWESQRKSATFLCHWAISTL